MIIFERVITINCSFFKLFFMQRCLLCLTRSRSSICSICSLLKTNNHFYRVNGVFLPQQFRHFATENHSGSTCNGKCTFQCHDCHSDF